MGRFRFLYGIVLLWLAVAVSGCALAIAGAAGGGAAGVVASAKQGQEERHSPVTYGATVLLDVLYVPAKVLVAGAGVLTSSLAYVVTAGDSDAFSAVWDSAVKGDYVLTPRMVEGKDSVHFAGMQPEEERADTTPIPAQPGPSLSVSNAP